jgi:hypothetical protein
MRVPLYSTFGLPGAVLGAGHLFVGNSSNVATDTIVSGDANLASNGVLTVGGLLTKALPTLAAGFLKYNGSAWVFDSTAYGTSNFSGAYADLSGKPTLFSGAYADLSGKPTLFSGAYADLSGKPTLGTAAAHDIGYFEPALGNPGTSGYVLSSTAAGVRSWVAQSGGLSAIANNTVLGNISGASAVPVALTAGNLKTLLALTQNDIANLTTSSAPTFAGMTLTSDLASSGHSFSINPGASTTGSAVITIQTAYADGYDCYLILKPTGYSGGSEWHLQAGNGASGNAGANFIIRDQTNSRTVLSFANTTGYARFPLYGAGTTNFLSDGTLSSSSDERQKDILGPYTPGLGAVRKLHPKRWKFNAASGFIDDLKAGLTAQDLMQAGLGDAVYTQRTVPVMETVAALDLNGRPILDKQDVAQTVQQAKVDTAGKVVTQKVDASYTVDQGVVIGALVNAIKELVDRLEKVENI